VDYLLKQTNTVDRIVYKIILRFTKYSISPASCTHSMGLWASSSKGYKWLYHSIWV